MKTNTPQFDFTKVGKRTPFCTPEGYFEASEKELRSIVHRKSFHHKLYYGIAASFVLAVGIWSFVRFALPQTTASDEQFCSQTYDNSVDWSEFAEADIFLDNID